MHPVIDCAESASLPVVRAKLDIITVGRSVLVAGRKEGLFLLIFFGLESCCFFL